jgi:putative transposase
MAETNVAGFRRSFKYRLCPSKRQEAVLGSLIDAARHLYNDALEQRRDAWKARKVSVNLYTQSAQLTDARAEFEELRALPAQVGQDVLHRLQSAFDGFFRRLRRGETPGYPRFQGRDRFDSITFPQYPCGVRLLDRKIRVQNVGDLRIRLHRPVEGSIKTVTLKRETGKWFAVFSCDQVSARAYPSATAEIGIDMGLESFATLSTGEKIENPRWFRASETRLAEAQRSLERKKKGGNRRRKAKQCVARLHAKIANQRRDFQHKLSHQIVSENALIAVEDLEPGRMAERAPSGLSKSIHDASWSMFFLMLASKAAEAGREFVKVPPRGTSSTCSRCGAIKAKALSERTHECPCGLVLDRDINASLNILRLGRSLQASA